MQTETAASWISRHEATYQVPVREEDFDCNRVEFVALEHSPSYACLCQKNLKYSVFINLETADDCEAMCKLLRVEPRLK